MTIMYVEMVIITELLPQPYLVISCIVGTPTELVVSKIIISQLL